MAFFFKRHTSVVEESTVDHIYLIDTENVRSIWTELLERLTDQDKVYVFYTMNSGNISYEQITGILQYGEHVELQECFTGKNGLDFQLISYLGYLIRGNENAEYNIVSDDSGFDAAVKFWKKKGINIARKSASDVSGKPAKRLKNPFAAKKLATPKKDSKSASLLKENSKQTASKQEDVPNAAEKSQKLKTVKTSQEARSSAEARITEETMTPAQSLVAKMLRESKAELGEAEVKEPQPAQAKPQSQPKQQKKQSDSSSKEKQNSNGQKTKVKSELKNGQAKVGTQGTKQENKKNIKQPKPQTAPLPKQEAHFTAADVAVLLPGEPKERVDAVYEILVRAGNAKAYAPVHDGIEKLYRDEHGAEVYRLIKPHMKELYNK